MAELLQAGPVHMKVEVAVVAADYGSLVVRQSHLMIQVVAGNDLP